jgi:hypothetical protein
MLRPIICGLLLTVGLVTAQNGPGKGGHCAEFASFGPKDSLNTANLRLETKDLRVQVNAKGPELHLQLEPDASASMSTWKGGTNAASQRVGWIRLFSCETGALIQSLEVQSLRSPEWFLRFFEVRDANFDGYLDIAVLVDGGALWGSQTWWVFSPASGKFISNEFTEALSRIHGNGLEFDATRHHIIVSILLGPGRCSRFQDIYNVEQSSRLVLIHKEGLTPTWDPSHSYAVGCTLTTRELVDGQMQVTKVEHFPVTAQ